jgi:DNA repair protein RadC
MLERLGPLMSRRPISKWPLAERPREKLLQEGPRALSDSELLAIILRLGIKGASAIDLAREVLGHFGGFRRMADADLHEWRQIKGLGTAKTASLIAAVEIARRFWAEPSAPSAPIKSAAQVVELFGPHLRDLKHEVFDILLLNGKRRSLGSVRMDDGTVTETSTYAREIMSVALQKRAAGVVLVHNHPSGDPSPSSADTDLTRRAVFAGKVMDVKVQDHVIIGDKAFYSFAEEGVIGGLEHEWEKIALKGVSNDQ